MSEQSKNTLFVLKIFIVCYVQKECRQMYLWLCVIYVGTIANLHKNFWALDLVSQSHAELHTVLSINVLEHFIYLFPLSVVSLF